MRGVGMNVIRKDAYELAYIHALYFPRKNNVFTADKRACYQVFSDLYAHFFVWATVVFLV
ncbi:hypothetical protein SOASR030_07640 [Leminorella grimontii]|uniref:Uncharacterized protein n=1 Tax=Leminorella grimontii TaxID=82981 RepID=A0AAV5MYT4_9GAMM|nr:hypothetical protein SOASR030_07640 [Leminorella grimontii]GKX58070.1 hypothetical protein SOASR031_03850 [Leminorella grimontii]